MKYKDNLNKENFFNQIGEQYPRSLQLFCDWIDQYKKKVKWTDLFWSRVPGIKFHDLPYEMQVGVITKFFLEKNTEYGLDLTKPYCYFPSYWDKAFSVLELRLKENPKPSVELIDK